MLRRAVFIAARCMAALTLWTLSVATVNAVSERVFPLLPGTINADWKGQGGFAGKAQQDGVHIAMQGTGMFIGSAEMSADAQLLTIDTTSQQSIQGRFVWETKERPGQVFISPISVAAGKHVVSSISLSHLSAWKGTITSFGIELPANAYLTLHGLMFSHFSVIERAIIAWQSLWTFDSYFPTSINFLWGPQIASNPYEAKDIFVPSTPVTLSATFVFNIIVITVLLLTLAIVLWHVPHPQKRRVFVQIAAIVLFGFWLLLDVRMGSEWLAWMQHDYSTYISAPAGTRTLRERGQFYDFVEFVKPLISDRPSYVAVLFQQWPYLGNLRYYTYPVLPSNDVEYDDTWVIYHRPDIDVDSTNRLTFNGEPVSQPGKILGRFNEDSFVFRISPSMQ